MHYEPLQATDWSERMDRLRFAFGKWDLDVAGKPTVPAGALVLDAHEHKDIVRLSEAMDAMLGRLRAKVQRDPAALERLGVQPSVAQAMADEPPHGLVTRIDWFRTDAGWVASEANDDCPGGYNEAIGLPAVLGDLAPAGTHVAGALPAQLVDLALGATPSPDGVREATASRPAAPDPVAILFATGYAEDLQVADLLRRLVHDAGGDAVLASPGHARLDRHGTVTVLGRRVGRILRFFPTEWMPDLPNWSEWPGITRAVPVHNPLATAATQSKAMPIVAHAVPGDDGDFARRHLMPTWRLDADQARRAVAERDRLVLKPAFGRMGDGILVGTATPPEAWAKAIRAAARGARTTPFVLQERFSPQPVETRPGQAAVACVGAYVVDGRFAGYYTRLSHRSVVAHDAANVLTVVAGL